MHSRATENSEKAGMESTKCPRESFCQLYDNWVRRRIWASSYGVLVQYDSGVNRLRSLSLRSVHAQLPPFHCIHEEARATGDLHKAYLGAQEGR